MKRARFMTSTQNDDSVYLFHDFKLGHEVDQDVVVHFFKTT